LEWKHPFSAIVAGPSGSGMLCILFYYTLFHFTVQY